MYVSSSLRGVERIKTREFAERLGLGLATNSVGNASRLHLRKIKSPL